MTPETSYSPDMDLRAIIVDDETSGREILVELLDRFCNGVEVVAQCSDVPSAAAAIRTHHPDLVLLDVEMPGYAGYELVDFMDDIDFQIIFVTAHDRYAMKAFEVSAIDYLLKPIDIDRLCASIEKARTATLVDSYGDRLNDLARRFRAAEHRIRYVDKGYTAYQPVHEIVAFEAFRAYARIHCSDGRVLTVSRNLSQLADEVADCPQFVRSHRSWIVNIEAVSGYASSRGTARMTSGLEARVSRSYKEAFERALR